MQKNVVLVKEDELCLLYRGLGEQRRAGAGMGRMVAVSVTPRGTGTALLFLISVAPLPDSAA
jgi:hypothetical protein